MSDIPEHMLRTRDRVSRDFIHGNGIEVGALHHPLGVGDNVNVRYLDRLPEEELRQHYPELNRYDLVSIDIIDDGETMATVQDGSLDFIIANHMLEHCENPLGAMHNHLRKLKPSGVIYYAIPDKSHSFDAGRPLTSFEHLEQDDRVGPQISREHHFREWVTLVNQTEGSGEIQTQLEKLMKINYSIHFHVWDFDSFREFIDRARQYHSETFTLELLEQNDTEIIAVLRKK